MSLRIKMSIGSCPLIFARTIPKDPGAVIVDDDELRHLSVLRMAQGERVDVFDGSGNYAHAEVVASSGRRKWSVISVIPRVFVPWKGPRWTICVGGATLKGSRGDWLCEKASELGGRDSRYQRWSRVSVSAAKQSLRLHCLDLNPEIGIAELASKIRDTEAALLAKQGGSHIGNLVGENLLDGDGYLIIGPEGDFTEREKTTLLEAGARPVGLGSQRLRVETAALAMLAIVNIGFSQPERPY